MANPIKTAQRFLKVLNENLNSAELLNQLLEELENKSDPEPNEIAIVSQLYSLLENLKNVEHNLHSYIGESMNPQGSKLSQLWEDRHIDGYNPY